MGKEKGKGREKERGKEKGDNRHKRRREPEEEGRPGREYVDDDSMDVAPIPEVCVSLYGLHMFLHITYISTLFATLTTGRLGRHSPGSGRCLHQC